MYCLYFDGGSRGNPGVSGCGAVLCDGSGKELASCYYYCGDLHTNNHAEYMGLSKGIEMVLKLGIDPKTVKVFGDSKLVICQCKGEFKVKNDALKILHEKIKTQLGIHYQTIGSMFADFQHIRRTENKRADELSNIAMDLKASSNI